MKKIKTAVIGLGRIGWLYHIPEIIKHKGFELLCVCDPLAERLKEAEEQFNIPTYDNIDEMFTKERPELTVIASPTNFHPQHCITAFEYGSNVFCEKPVAVSTEETDDIFNKMKLSGKKFMAYQPHRAGADIQCLKGIMESGILGDIFMIKRTRTDYVRRSDWQAFSELGGGMLNNFGSHLVDQMLYLSQSTPKKIYCSAKKIASLGNAEDVVKIDIETENNILLDIDINMASALPVQPWIVFGRYGTASLDSKTQVWNVKYCKPSEFNDVYAQKSLAAQHRVYDTQEAIKWHTEQYRISDYEPVDYYDECYKYFEMNEKPIVSYKESRLLVQTLCFCKEQIENNSQQPCYHSENKVLATIE